MTTVLALNTEAFGHKCWVLDLYSVGIKVSVQ